MLCVKGCQLLHEKMKYSSTRVRPSFHLKAINSWMDIEKQLSMSHLSAARGLLYFKSKIIKSSLVINF